VTQDGRRGFQESQRLGLMPIRVASDNQRDNQEISSDKQNSCKRQSAATITITMGGRSLHPD
jgi:hypothetical protein